MACWSLTSSSFSPSFFIPISELQVDGAFHFTRAFSSSSGRASLREATSSCASRAVETSVPLLPKTPDSLFNRRFCFAILVSCCSPRMVSSSRCLANTLARLVAMAPATANAMTAGFPERAAVLTSIDDAELAGSPPAICC